MRKSLVCVLFLVTSAFGFGQAIWSGTTNISVSAFLNGASTATGTVNGSFGGTDEETGDPILGRATFSGGSFGNYYYEFNFANGDPTSLSRNNNGNLRLYINNQVGSWIMIPSGTLKFTLTLPTTTTGTVTGVSVVSDSYGFSPWLSVTADGAGTLTLTQTGTFLTSSNGENLVLNFTTTPVPEPSTYAALAGVLALGATILVRRRRSQRLSA